MGCVKGAKFNLTKLFLFLNLTNPHHSCDVLLIEATGNGAETQCQFVSDGAVMKLLSSVITKDLQIE